MKFNCNKQSFSKMSTYISSIYKNKELLTTMSVIKKIKSNKKNNDINTTTRMAVIDMSVLHK